MKDLKGKADNCATLSDVEEISLQRMRRLGGLHCVDRSELD